MKKDSSQVGDLCVLVWRMIVTGGFEGHGNLFDLSERLYAEYLPPYLFAKGNAPIVFLCYGKGDKEKAAAAAPPTPY